jgi:hypothetical protein
MVRMQSSPLFWPSDRKLFRQRSRAWTVVPIVAVVTAAFLVAVFGPIDWR